MTKPLLEMDEQYNIKLHGNAKKCIDAWFTYGNIVCECKRCGGRWISVQPPNRRQHRGWWKCPFDMSFGFSCSDLILEDAAQSAINGETAA